MTRAAASTYDDDFYAWTQEQAAALRGLPPAAVGSAVDIAHVAEEIEDLGKRDLREVTSHLGLLVEHLIKIAAMPASRDVPHWRGEARNFQAFALEAFSPSMRRALTKEAIARVAGRRVAAAIETGLDLEMPACLPFEVDELLVESFDLDAFIARVASIIRSPNQSGP